MKTTLSILKKISLWSIAFVSIAFTTSDAPSIGLEKIYTHTDRPFYFPGETIWFKSYVVGTENTVSTTSDALFAELISPKGTVVKTLKLDIQQGYSYGDFTIAENWVGGIYTLKMYTHWMQNYGDTSFFTKKIPVQKVVRPKVLLSLKFEKEAYGKAAKVKAHFEVKDVKNQPLPDKEISFAVLIKGKSLLTKKIRTNAEGKATPNFTLPSTLTTTDVVLNVLVPYNGSTESISRSVPIVLDNVDLQFFPESGKIIENTQNHVAFKAINEFGKPTDVSGLITDENGNTVTTFESFHDGMGGFYFTPHASTTYYAHITKPFLSVKKVALPQAYPKGTRFSIKNSKEKTELQLFSNDRESLTLHISNASKLVYEQKISVDDKEITIPTGKFPMGIAKFTLLDIQERPVAERLVFINPRKKLFIKVQPNKETYETREKVILDITTLDEANNPIPSNLSISVADNKLLSFADDKQDHIESYLLLSSELQGKIHKPQFYFDSKEPKAHKALDYVMLTHGWRNYIQNNRLDLGNALYKPEQKGLQAIHVTDTKGRPTQAHILVFDRNGTKVLVGETNKKGEYVFKLTPRIQHIVLAYRDDKKQLRIIEGTLTKQATPFSKNTKNKQDFKQVKGFQGVKKPLQKPIQQQAIATIHLEEDSQALEEVVIVGYGSETKRNLSGSVTHIQMEELINQGNILNALQGRVAGLQINNTGGVTGNATTINLRGVASISGDNEPLFILDGVPLESRDFRVLDHSKIASITVLKDMAATTLYGTAASNGVILINSKNGIAHNWKKKKLNNAKYNNYAVSEFYAFNSYSNYREKQFYVPQYRSKEPHVERTDFRQTIYWNPVVQTNENGKASLEFYNSDAITSFKITTEGIGYNGLVGRDERDYSTKKVLNIDFKVPNYMTVNDTVVLPITLHNTSDKALNITIDLQVPSTIKILGNNLNETILEANTTILKNIKIVPLQTSTPSIRIAVRSPEYSDVVHKKVAIVSPYFPTEMAISGNKNQMFQFNVENVVPQSISAEFNIYTDIVGDVMDGIEGMIQKPYGCFEQTSSSTYPNIMILQYLKEAGKSNSKIERRALKFIREGYRRLISFETNQGGFEWFGQIPPHETLTAYGILEFTEMKEVYKGVSKKMIQRTVKWLMSRRNGKGGFQKSKKGYDSFASSPEKVANAYIVYALSEAGVAVDIQKEYEHAYKEALQSNDSYRMALMALASYNFKKIEQGRLLLEKIKQNISVHGFSALPVSNTITRSYGNAKQIETSAFTVLALLRAQEQNKVFITQGIAHILENRKHGSFGATQSTAMALKALIAYTKNEKKKVLSITDSITLSINGHSLKQQLKHSADGRIRISGIENYIKEGKQKVSVQFNNPKIHFSYGLNVQWDSYLPDSSEACKVAMETHIPKNDYAVGDIIPMKVDIINKEVTGIPMVTAIIGIPSGASLQPWQLKEFLEQEKVAYYELSDNYLVCYWREFAPSETKTLHFSLKAEIAGNYTAAASSVYLYYGDEDKQWIPGAQVMIRE